MSTEQNTNQSLLDAANVRGEWFRARKTQGLWAKRLASAEEIDSIEGPLQAEPGDFLCRGVKGEYWPQSQASLEKKYVATDEVDADGFRRYEVKPGSGDVMATTMSGDFSLDTKWGAMDGTSGDYLVKRYEDRDESHPEDVWVVSQAVFESTYETVDAG